MNTPIRTSLERPQKDLLAKFSRSLASAMILIAVALVCLELLPTASRQADSKPESDTKSYCNTGANTIW